MDRLDDYIDEAAEPFEKFMKPVCTWLSNFCEDMEDPNNVDMTDAFIELMLVMGESLKMNLRRLEGLVRKDLAEYLACVAAYSQGEILPYNLEFVCDMTRENFSSKDQIKDAVDRHHLVGLLLRSPPTAVFLLGAYKNKVEDLISQYSIDSLDEITDRRVAHSLCVSITHQIATLYSLIGMHADSHVHIGSSAMIGSSANSHVHIGVADDDYYTCVEGNDFVQSYLEYLTDQMKRA